MCMDMNDVGGLLKSDTELEFYLIANIFSFSIRAYNSIVVSAGQWIELVPLLVLGKVNYNGNWGVLKFSSIFK